MSEEFSDACFRSRATDAPINGLARAISAPPELRFEISAQDSTDDVARGRLEL